MSELKIQDLHVEVDEPQTPLRGAPTVVLLHGFTVSSRADDRTWEAYSRSYVGDLILVAHFVNQKALELDHGTDVQHTASLSPREIDTLSLLAMGYSRAQAADSLVTLAQEWPLDALMFEGANPDVRMGLELLEVSD